MNKNLIIFLIIALLIGGGIFWYSTQSIEEVENNTKLPNETNIEEPDTEEPVEEEESEKMSFEVYFNNFDLDPSQDCSNVFPVTRTVDAEGVEEPVTKALTLLIEGPTEEEKEEGYSSSINSEAKINSLEIENGTAYVDFSSELDEGVAGSCTVQSIKSQIKETLETAPDVSNVVISVEGETETILQP